MLTAIQNGHLQFADGSSRPIPHYDDSTYIVFYCVRYCEKVKDGSKDPDLTPEGQARAERLGRILAGGQIDRICTTT